ncbi:MAG: transcriptional regulator [Bacteroidia bacterium]
MTKRTKEVNPGGVNGTGKGVVNTNSKDFKGLRDAVQNHAQKQTLHEKIYYELISLRFQMESYVTQEEPPIIIEVGEFLKRHMKAIRIKNKDFAKYIDLEDSNLSSTIRGRRKVSIDLAFKLGQLFDVDPNIWLLIQSKNELLSIDKKRRRDYQKYRLEDLLKKAG